MIGNQVQTDSRVVVPCDKPEPMKSRLVQRIRAEFMEMPGMTLTLQQASRLWGLDAREAECLFSTLVNDGFLFGDERGVFRRRDCPRCC